MDRSRSMLMEEHQRLQTLRSNGIVESGTSSPIVGATTETLANLGAGDYTVEVTDILSPGNTCSSTAMFTIVDDLPVFTITSASITVTDQTDCVANGSAEVTDILVDGVSNAGTTGFTFEWFDEREYRLMDLEQPMLWELL